MFTLNIDELSHVTGGNSSASGLSTSATSNAFCVTAANSSMTVVTCVVNNTVVTTVCTTTSGSAGGAVKAPAAGGGGRIEGSDGRCKTTVTQVQKSSFGGFGPTDLIVRDW